MEKIILPQRLITGKDDLLRHICPLGFREAIRKKLSMNQKYRQYWNNLDVNHMGWLNSKWICCL